MAVNKPMDKAMKDEDIGRKLQLYGIYCGFQNGKLPSNDQIDIALNSFLGRNGIATPPEALSAEGKVLVADLRDVVRRAQDLVLSNNSGNLLQDFIWQTRQFDPKSVSAIKAPVNLEQAKQDGSNAVGGLRTLGKLLITNGQFRKLIRDMTVLARDMAGDAATNAASRVRPSEDELSQMDKPAEDNTWHEAPEFSRAKLKERATRVYSGTKKDAKDVADRGTVTEAATAAKQKATESLDEDTKEKIQRRNEELRQRAREYLKKKMPQERKDQTIWRLKKMVLECQQHPDYMRAVQTLLDLARQYGSHGRHMASDASGSAKGAHSGFSKAETDLKTLIERFANGTSTDDLWDSIRQIYKDADSDQEFRGWFTSMDSYIRRCLLEQGYIMDEGSTQEWDRLYNHARYLFRDKYRQHSDRVIHETRFLADQFDQDAKNRQFRTSIEKLFADLGHDQNGKVAFKPHLVKDLSDVIIPSMLANTSYVPIPRIEYQDDMLELVVENAVLESDNFMPNVASVYSENFFKWGRKTAGSAQKQTFEILVKGVQMDMRDVGYYVRKKKGFPKIQDHGTLDILLPGDGFGVKMRMSTADPKDVAHRFFRIDKVDVDVQNLNVKFTKSKHKLLLTLLKPLALRAVRPVVKIVAEKVIKEQGARLDALLWDIKQEADAAAKKVYEDPSQAPSMYERYMKAIKDRLAKGKKKTTAAAEEAAKKKQKINVALTNEKSLFPHVLLAGSVTSKATEYSRMAKQGEQWQSPVFSIGSATRSASPPPPPSIERKPHKFEPSTKAAASPIGGNGKAPVFAPALATAPAPAPSSSVGFQNGGYGTGNTGNAGNVVVDGYGATSTSLPSNPHALNLDGM